MTQKNNSGFLFFWALRMSIFIFSLLPIYSLGSTTNGWIEIIFGGVVALFFLQLCIGWNPKLCHVEKKIMLLQVVLSLVLFAYVFYYWALIYSMLFWLAIAIFAVGSFFTYVGFFSQRKKMEWIASIIVVPCLFLLIVLFQYEVPIGYAVTAKVLIGTMVLNALALFLRQKNKLLLNWWLFLAVFNFHAMSLCVSHYFYLADQRDQAEKVASRDGIESIKVSERYLPFHDISAMMINNGTILSFPRHEPYLYAKKGEELTPFMTGGAPADSLVIDSARKKAWFLSGAALHEISLIDNSIIKVHEFDKKEIFQYRGPNFIHPNSGPEVKKLLVQFDMDKGVYIYDVKKNEAKRINSELKLVDSVWHPDGDKIISYGMSKHEVAGQFLLMDTNGKILTSRTIFPFDDVTLGEVDENGEFFATYFFSGKLERVNAETLEANLSFNTKRGHRIALESKKYDRVILFNYLFGEGTVYKKSDMTLVDRFLVGKRIRGITAKPDGSGYWFTSSSGLFSIDMDKIFQSAAK